MSHNEDPIMRIIRLREVIDSTGLARSTVYKYIAEGTFPKPVALGDRAVGWVQSEVQDWIMARIEQRDEAESHNDLRVSTLPPAAEASLRRRAS